QDLWIQILFGQLHRRRAVILALLFDIARQERDGQRILGLGIGEGELNDSAAGAPGHFACIVGVPGVTLLAFGTDEICRCCCHADDEASAESLGWLTRWLGPEDYRPCHPTVRPPFSIS